MATGANERAACLSVSIKRCLILDLKIGVSFVSAMLPCMKFHIHASSEMTIENRNPLPLSAHRCLPSPAVSLCPILLLGCPDQPSGMLTSFDQVFIISDSDACLSEAESWRREKRGLRVQEASPQRTETSPGIPPALMRSIPVRRSPQAAFTRWNARPLSLTALLRAISNSLSE